MQPIVYQGVEALSFRQIDDMNGLAKGTAFRLFKRCRDQLEEGRDYYYLPDASHGDFIESLKVAGSIYLTTRHLVLVTRVGYERMQGLKGRENVANE
ncbi:hypothetical protein [Halopseudomonas salegens]|uniref:KilA-N DNA-binding domain-containing protein n=1 Tax=Halopseudomonas salegens TaxID=1434072 RepID=A0A1H2HBZ5_9GAMM|nr:hypothetical protein [Halopseudomonas salegens]SDU29354.1 hypothetical protein SAMN05216210_2929 [Halopseudomonas salegens]